jgi:hypothetical protein
MQWTDVTTLGSRSLWLLLARRAANGSRVEVRHRADMLPQHLGKLTLRRFDGGALSCQNEVTPSLDHLVGASDVLRLTMKSNLLGRSMGNSPAFAPLLSNDGR